LLTETLGFPSSPAVFFWAVLQPTWSCIQRSSETRLW